MANAPKMENGLTLKQEAFIGKYIEHKGNGTEAAMEAYNPANRVVASAIASENLQKPAIAERIAELREQIASYAPEAAKRIAELSKSARSEKVKLDASKDILDRTGVLSQRDGNVFTGDVKMVNISITAPTTEEATLTESTRTVESALVSDDAPRHATD